LESWWEVSCKFAPY